MNEQELKEEIRLETGLSFGDEVWKTIAVIIPVIRAGYVKLAKDQTLPEIEPGDTIISYVSKLVNWRRVILEVKDGH